MITPPYLKKGDKVAIVATARKIHPEELSQAIRLFESWGLKVVTGKNIHKVFHQFAGTDDERMADMQEAIDNTGIRAIFFARGGYGSIRIIDKLDFSGIAKNPKWIAGFSDITILHSHIQTCCGIETLHCTMPYSIYNNPDSLEPVASMRKTLFGEEISYSFPGDLLSRKGQAEGILCGGNLSILYSLIGSPSDLDTHGKILFIEDIDEYLYHIDRMMISLKRSGKLTGLAGLLVGDMTDMKDNEVKFGMDAYSIIADAVKDYNYPVWFGFPAGHSALNNALILGRKVSMQVSKISSLNFF